MLIPRARRLWNSFGSRCNRNLLLVNLEPLLRMLGQRFRLVSYASIGVKIVTILAGILF